MDHLIPIARGGKSTKNNCVPSCKECNSKKGYKTRAEMALEELKSSQTSQNIEEDSAADAASEVINSSDKPEASQNSESIESPKSPINSEE